MKTLFILKDCDGLQLRQAIEEQLNKGEGSNKFSKAVCLGHSHEFVQARRLSRVLAEEKREERGATLIESICNGSVAIWAHFNLHEEFDFSNGKMIFSMGLTPPKNQG